MATRLAAGNRVPLGKYLLGSVYHMLHQTISQMHTGQMILCVNGPWWFVQMCLQLYMHQIVNIDLNNRLFEGPIRRPERGGGSEWEPIKILLEGD
jgi:hypothetical protein